MHRSWTGQAWMKRMCRKRRETRQLELVSWDWRWRCTRSPSPGCRRPRRPPTRSRNARRTSTRFSAGFCMQIDQRSSHDFAIGTWQLKMGEKRWRPVQISLTLVVSWESHSWARAFTRRRTRSLRGQCISSRTTEGRRRAGVLVSRSWFSGSPPQRARASTHDSGLTSRGPRGRPGYLPSPTFTLITSTTKIGSMQSTTMRFRTTC
mmetsp:Transcript_98548/g.306880  ORF Transcript_98548/g.306880 Transcript_98548/m.306880 type:complete len:206 (+) Transcript_98548:295-912(+)